MHWHEPTQAHVERRTTEGKTKPEIMRYLARQVYRCLVPAAGGEKVPASNQKNLERAA